jgi:hypothetical protein
MNDNLWIDPELQSLEARLASQAPRLPATEQTQLLYQCAFAAGKAAGQRACHRVIQASTAVTLVLALLCVSLAYRATLHHEPAPLAHTPPSHGTSEVERERSTVRMPTRDADDSHQISTATALYRTVDFDWPRQPPSTQLGGDNTTIESEQPMLTSQSRISPDSI